MPTSAAPRAATTTPHAFYPVLPDAEWLARVVPRGVKTVQLRFKDGNDDTVRRQISDSMELCARHGCQLIVNDYWQQAIALGADYIHLGQDDLAAADRTAIAEAGLHLGVSSHDSSELQSALAAWPDYVALGPIYETKLKKMKWNPQGLARVTDWKSRIGSLPLVAIGGITVERAQGVVDAGADSIAVVTDIVTHPEPERRIDEWLAWAATAIRA